MLELRSSCSGFDGQLCVCMLSVIFLTGAVEAFFSPMLSTCEHFRKMEQFSSWEGETQEHASRATTLPFWYTSVAKGAIDLEKHHAGG